MQGGGLGGRMESRQRRNNTLLREIKERATGWGGCLSIRSGQIGGAKKKERGAVAREDQLKRQ